MTSFKDGPLLYVTDKKVSTPKSVDSPNEANLWRKWWPLKMWIATLHQTFSSFWCFGKLLHKNCRTLLKLHNTRRCVGIWCQQATRAETQTQLFLFIEKCRWVFFLRAARRVVQARSCREDLFRVSSSLLERYFKNNATWVFIRTKTVFDGKHPSQFLDSTTRLQLLHKRRNYI